MSTKRWRWYIYGCRMPCGDKGYFVLLAEVLPYISGKPKSCCGVIQLDTTGVFRVGQCPSEA